MDAKEIGVRVKALNKAATGGEPAENIVTLLDSLKRNVIATEDLLRSTKVGVAVNRQKQNSNKEVAKLASEIVSKWRDDVNRLKVQAQRKANGSPKTINGESTDMSQAKITVPPDQRSWKKDGVDVKRLGNQIRDNCLGLIYDGLCYNSEESPAVVIKRAVDVERAAMQKYGPETEPAYKNKLRSLFQNLKNKSSGDLRTRVLAGEITPERLVVMTHDELKSAERRAEDDKLQKENMNKAMVAQAELSISDSLTCGKCHQKKVSYSQAQTRSADEPMTTFCECQVCGHRWKVSSVQSSTHQINKSILQCFPPDRLLPPSKEASTNPPSQFS
ncbi:MAG: RNA polymerase II elongation factor [Piccolia ochrophora]|nr:MAG: RNA polymerase II elongation factor [Piccolia ochrophora]